MRALVWAFAFSLPFLGGACGLCVWVRVLHLSRPFCFGFAVRAFGCGLRGRWWVCEGTGVAQVPSFLAEACSACLAMGWDVTSHFVAGFVVCMCGHGCLLYPAIPSLGLWHAVRFVFRLRPACLVGWGLLVGVFRPSWLEYVAIFSGVGGPSPVLVESSVGCGAPSPILVEGPLVVFPCLPWGAAAV